MGKPVEATISPIRRTPGSSSIRTASSARSSDFEGRTVSIEAAVIDRPHPRRVSPRRMPARDPTAFGLPRRAARSCRSGGRRRDCRARPARLMLARSRRSRASGRSPGSDALKHFGMRWRALSLGGGVVRRGGDHCRGSGVRRPPPEAVPESAAPRSTSVPRALCGTRRPTPASLVAWRAATVCCSRSKGHAASTLAASIPGRRC